MVERLHHKNRENRGQFLAIGGVIKNHSVNIERKVMDRGSEKTEKLDQVPISDGGVKWKKKRGRAVRLIGSDIINNAVGEGEHGNDKGRSELLGISSRAGSHYRKMPYKGASIKR